MQGTGWTKVVSKRPGFRWDVFPFGGRIRSSEMEKVTSFFVSEFPDYFNAKRLFELFGCSGKVVEVAISPRRTRLGKRFTFARFVDVVDGRLMGIRLDNIQIEGKKLHVNIPRFNRNQEVGAGRHGNSNSKGIVKHFNSSAGDSQGNSSGACRGKSGSYADIVGKKGQGLMSSKEEDAWFNFQSNLVLRSRFERAFLGRVSIPGSAYNLQTYLEMEGVFSIKVTPLGGNCCLLEEKEEGYIDDLIKEGETWRKSWFCSIEKWEAGMVDGRRDVWIRIFGVPIHVWSSDFFVALGEKWGRFICIDDNTAKGEAFDVARILINIPISLNIPDQVTVNIDGSIYRLCIREDTQGLYRSGGGYQKVPSSDGSSSESESVRPLLSDSGDSTRSEDIDATRIVSKGHQVVESSMKVHIGHSGIVSDDGSKRGSKGLSGVASEEKCSLSEDSNHSPNPDEATGVGTLCKGKVDPEDYVEPRLTLRSRKVTSISNSNAELDRCVNSIEFVEDAILVGHRSSNKDLFEETPEATRSFFVDSESRLITDVVHVEKVTLGLGTVASVSAYEPSPIFRIRKNTSSLNLLDMVRGKGVVQTGSGTHDCSVDSIESFETVSCFKHDNLMCLSSEGDKDPATADTGLCLRKGGCSGMVSVDSMLIPRLKVDVPSSDPSMKGSSSRGSPGIHTSFQGKLNSQSGTLLINKGASDNGNFLAIGSANPIKTTSNGLEDSVTFLKQRYGDSFGDRGEGKKIKKVILNSAARSNGRGRQNVKVQFSKSSKGFFPYDSSKGRGCSISGSLSTCYGEQSEESDIRRNNDRQWEYLKRDVGERLWEAMLALGVVDTEGRKSTFQGEDTGYGGRKVVKNIDQ